jgi:transcription termination factor Rho
MLAQQLGWNQNTEVAKNNRKPRQVPEPQDDPAASGNDPDQTQQMQPDSNSTDGADTSNQSSAEKGDSTKGDAKKDGNRASQQSADSDQEAQAESNPSQSEQKSGDQSGKQDRKQQSGGKPDANNSTQNSSLMNKAKDLFQNLLSSLKPPSSNPGNQQQNDPNNQGKGQPKQNDKNGQPKNSGQKGDQSEGQQGEQSQDQQDQNQQGNGKNDSQQATKQPGSGAGNQDGEKRIKQAEDQAAMGKITEILGKRSANLTGEATVEVQNTSQQLKTAYTAGTAQHAQSGGEVNRDEIPVAMEPFVQEYFGQARKQEPAAPAQGSTPAPAPQKK